MSRFGRSLFLLLCVPAVLLGQAPPQTVAAVTKETETNSQVMSHLDHLTNEIGPRLTGSERLTKACEWARDKFKSFGIDNARLEPWGEVEVGFDRGVHVGYLKAGNEQIKLTFGTNAWTPGTDGLKEGKAVLAPQGDEGLAQLKDTAKGAWVVRPPNCAVAKEVNDLCTEVGAFGVVATSGDPDLILTGGNHKTKWAELPKLVRVNLHKPAYDDLVKRLRAGDELTLGFDVQNRFKQGPVVVYNVLADIPGTEKPDEIVIVGGHIDSWDGATGTTDNGTGVATTMEAARLLKAAGAKPRRTIRFMLWSGEEQGLLGSYAWIKKHPEEMAKISAVLVHDGGTNYVSGIQSTEDMLPVMKKAFAPVIELLGQKVEASVETRPARGFGESRRSAESRPPPDESMKFMIAQVGSLPRGVGSDHDSFLGAGVPGFFWRQAGRANYRHTHHTQYDLYDAAIPEYQKHSAMVIALGALGVANLDDKLPRSADLASAGGGRGGAGPGRRRLGIQIAEDDNLTIDSVDEGGRAEKAGLKAGDKIVGIDGTAVKGRRDMSDALNAGTGKKVIAFLRNKQEQQTTVDFDESRPTSRPDSRAAR